MTEKKKEKNEKKMNEIKILSLVSLHITKLGETHGENLGIE